MVKTCRYTNTNQDGNLKTSPLGGNIYFRRGVLIRGQLRSILSINLAIHETDVLTVITVPFCLRETSGLLNPALIPQPCSVMKVRAQVTLEWENKAIKWPCSDRV